jgi:hypothetical protein
MNISFDFSLQRWLIGFWFWRNNWNTPSNEIFNNDLNIMINIGPCEWFIIIKKDLKNA